MSIFYEPPEPTRECFTCDRVGCLGCAQPSQSAFGCAQCGIDERSHGMEATSEGIHTWQKPSQQQIKGRMLARRAAEGAGPTESGEAVSAPALTAERFAQIRQEQPTEWLPNPWTINEVEADGDTPGYWQVLHDGTVIATLPDWAGNLALWMANSPDDIRDLLAEVERLRTAVPHAMRGMKEDAKRREAVES